MRFRSTLAALLLWLTPVGAVIAATSAVNNNVRIFEDTLWLIVFTLMVVAGSKLSEISGGGTRLAYWLLSLTGISGWLWKGIGLAKRVLLLDEPAWLFSVTRETFEGLTGVVLAMAFLVLVTSLRRLYRT